MKSLFMLSAAESAAGNLASLPLMTKGLLTTVIGLLGVFLVLGLFFLTIKLALPHPYADELHGDVEDLSEDVSDEMVHDDNDQPSGATDEAPQIVGQSPTVDENEIEHDA